MFKWQYIQLDFYTAHIYITVKLICQLLLTTFTASILQTTQPHYTAKMFKMLMK